MAAGEHTPESQRPPATPEQPNILKLLKDKVRELVDKVKAKFTQPTSQEDAQKVLESPPVQLATPEETQTKQKELRDSLRQLNHSLDEGNKQQLIQDVKNVAQDLAAIAHEKNAETRVKDYADVIIAAANKVTDTSAIPFARYLTQAAGDNALAIRTEDDVMQHLRRIRHIFLDEAELQSNDLNAASALMEGILKKNGDLMHEPTLTQAGEIVGQLINRGAQSVDAYNQFKELSQRLRTEFAPQNGVESDKANTSPSINSFVGHYKNLEKAILECELSGTPEEQTSNRRKLLYNFLEIDINHETEKMRKIFESKTDYSEAFDEWGQGFVTHYLHGLDGSSVPVPSAVRDAADKYAKEFVRFMKIRIDRLKNYYQGMGDRDVYTRPSYQPPTDLSRFFQKGVFDDAYIALAFIDAEGVDNKNNLDIKDIFMRFKLKGALAHDKSDHNLFGPNGDSLDIHYEQIEHSLLNTFKAPYLRAYRYQLEGIRGGGDQEFQLILNKVENLIGGRKFSDSPKTFTFLGGSADVAEDKSKALNLRVKSKLFTESPASPGLHGKGFLETQKYTVSLKHRSLGELMTDFHEKISHLHHVAEQAKRMQEAVRDGKSEAMQESARIFTNEVLDSMGLESPIILNAMLAYVNTFKSTVYAGQGAFRPSLFASSPEGNESPQDAALKRAIRSTHPEATDDELAVFSTIGRALAWGIGDLGRWMARVLPPMDTLVRPKDLEALSEKMKELQQKHKRMSDEEMRKERTDILFNHLAKTRPELATVFYDQYARAFLAQTNPFFHGMIWADTSHEYKIHELLFGGEYTINPDDMRPSKVKGINPLRVITEALPKPLFSRKDTLATPKEILIMAEKEKISLYDGLDEETFEARVAGKAPIMLRLVELAGNTGIAERAGWRMDARQTESFIHQFVRDRAEREVNPKPVTEVFSTDDIKDLFDRSLILGPYAGLEVIKACFGTPGIGANTYISPDITDDEKKVFEDYVYKKMYEYFPSIFVGRMDMRRHVRKGNDIFSNAWYKEIYKDLYQNSESELHRLVPKESHAATLQRDRSADMMEVRGADVKARAVQNLLFDAQLILESSILEQRNAIKVYSETIPTLRETLHYLATKDEMSEEDKTKWLAAHKVDIDKVEKVANNLALYIKEANLLSDDPQQLMRIIARNLYKNLYGSSDTTLNIVNNKYNRVALSDTRRGLVDKLKFEDIGADTPEKRREKVDTFKFLRNLKRAGLNGPVFDFYYENLGDFFSAQLTGDRASGKELINRKYSDLSTYIKGLGQSMGALNKIADGVKSFNQEDLKKAEAAFLSAVNEAGSTFEGYNNEEKRHEVAYHLMLQWIMMGRIPGRQGFDLRFSPWGLPMVRELLWQKKSLAELVGDMGNGLINSAMVYDNQETENFIFEAQRKGVLPINRDGKVLQAVTKRRYSLGNGTFTRVFENVETQIKAYKREAIDLTDEEKEKRRKNPLYHLYKKVTGLPEHIQYKVFQGIHQFGEGAVNPTLARNDKYKWSAGKMLEQTGMSMSREYMQFGVYAFYFMILMLLLAIGYGAKELEIKA